MTLFQHRRTSFIFFVFYQIINELFVYPVFLGVVQKGHFLCHEVFFGGGALKIRAKQFKTQLLYV